MTAQRTAPTLHRFNPYLHGLRGLLALMILLYHVVHSGLPTFRTLSEGIPNQFLTSFAYAVELFFGLSGIVIVGALQRAKSPFLFVSERATRIFPVLWVSIVVLLAITRVTGFEGRSWPSLPVLIANLLGLPPMVPVPLIHPAAWSLCFEFVFYGFCALAWVVRRRIGGWMWYIAAPLAAALLFFHMRAALMPLGMFAAISVERYPRLPRFALAPGLFLLAFLFSWTIMAMSHDGDIDAQFFPTASTDDLLLFALALPCAFMAFVGIRAGNGLLSRALHTAPLQFLGTISYSLYLWHPLVMGAVKHAMLLFDLPARLGACSQVAFLALALPPSLVLAIMSQQVLEKRLTRWLRRTWEGAGNAPITAAH